jgi:acetylglutamate kinase
VAQLTARGVRAVGLTGVDGATFVCTMDDPELGFVGSVRETRTDLTGTLLANGYVPVMAPLGVVLSEGAAQPVNLNADTAAGHLAAALQAEALVLLTDTPGVRDGEGRIMPALSRAECGRLGEAGVITGGMLPKVAAALVAVDGGVPAIIADGREAGALTAALAGRAGTRLTA